MIKNGGGFGVKYTKTISLLVLCIVVLSLAASAYGIFSSQGPGEHQYKSLNGQTVSIYGQGLYKNDSVAMAAQAKGQDKVTMIVGIPLLIVSLYLSRKGLLKGRLLLTGTLGYFLYTYISYSFLSMYNSLFLIDVILMSASFYAFTLSMMSFDIQNLSSHFKENLPVKFIGGFLIFTATAIGMMWLGIIIPPLTNGTLPSSLEHYTTLVIQAMDLGFVVPTAIISGILLIKRKAFGYLLASVVIIKASTMLTAISVMIIEQAYAGVQMGLVALVMFPVFNLLTIYCLVLILRNIKELQQ
jgi:hypothetical protein